MGFEYGARERVALTGATRTRWAGLAKASLVDLSEDIAAANGFLSRQAGRFEGGELNVLAPKGTPVRIGVRIARAARGDGGAARAVLLNRAPTLHRLGIQAFEPILVEGKAIEIHPLVCTAFNADFDGDQMAVHVPLSHEAQLDAQILMLSSNNVLSPANGAPLVIPTQDMVLGIYYLTKERKGARGEDRRFADMEEVRMAYDAEQVELQARIRVRGFNPESPAELVETTVGRVLFNEIVPRELRPVNKELKKKEITALVQDCYHLLGNAETVKFLDDLKDIGFRYASLSGLSIGIDDMHVPTAKGRHIAEARRLVDEVDQQYQDGVITPGERYNKIVDIWAHTTEQIAASLAKRFQNAPVEQVRRDICKYLDDLRERNLIELVAA